MPKAQKLKPGQVVKIEVEEPSPTGRYSIYHKTHFVLIKSTEKKKGAHNISYTKYYAEGFTIYSLQGDIFRINKLQFSDVDDSIVDLWLSKPETEIQKAIPISSFSTQYLRLKDGGGND